MNLKEKFNRINRLDPNVYRLYYKKTPFGTLRSEQMEKRWRAEKLRELSPFKRNIEIKRERPDVFQRAERKKYKRLTGFVELLLD